MADDDDAPVLSPAALAALREFYAERAAQREREEAEEALATSASLVSGEDWQLSQFWYDEETSLALARELLHCATEARRESGRADAEVGVACLACPSMFKALRACGVPPWLRLVLFEVDPRFAVFGDSFVHYDFNRPLDFPAPLRGSFDVIALDPPFLQRGCLAAFAQTVAALQRPRDGGSGGAGAALPPDSRLLLCTGTVMARAARELLGVHPVRQHVGHANRLSNPFSLYVSYDDGGRLGGADDGVVEEAEEGGAGGGAGLRPAE